MGRLTQAQKRDNARRAQRARNVMDAYTLEVTKDESNLADLLADLMHRSHVDCEAEDFNNALDRARMNFEAERDGRD